MTNRIIAGYMGPGLRVRGKLSGAGEMVIDGRFDGEIDVDGTIEIGAAGTVSSSIDAKVVMVRGVTEGSVRAEAVSVDHGGRLVGDVRADRVALSDGGLLEGTVTMDFDLPAGLSETP